MERVPVNGYDGFYEIDRNGNIFSTTRKNSTGRTIKGKQLKMRLQPNGREVAFLYKNGKQKQRYVDELIKEHFEPNTTLPNLPHDARYFVCGTGDEPSCIKFKADEAIKDGSKYIDVFDKDGSKIKSYFMETNENGEELGYTAKF